MTVALIREKVPRHSCIEEVNQRYVTRACDHKSRVERRKTFGIKEENLLDFRRDFKKYLKIDKQL